VAWTSASVVGILLLNSDSGFSAWSAPVTAILAAIVFYLLRFNTFAKPMADGIADAD
jgi:hypothetical protein